MFKPGTITLGVLGAIVTVAGVSGLHAGVAADLSSQAGVSDEPLQAPTETDDRVAQFFPYANADEQVVMVQGQGSATASAETAEVEIVLTNYDPYYYYDPYACESEATAEELGVECEPPPEPEPLTQASLQPVIAVLTEAGVPASAISTRLPGEESDDYSASYYPDSASVSFVLNNPSQSQVVEMMTALDDALFDSDTIYLQDRYVQYTLSAAGCESLEQEAYRAAIANARTRAAVMADALGVEVGGVPSVADSIFSGSGTFFNLYPSYCDTLNQPISSYSYTSPSYYDSTLPTEVQVQRAVFVTYPVVR